MVKACISCEAQLHAWLHTCVVWTCRHKGAHTRTHLAGRHGQALGGGVSASREKVQVTCCSRRPWHSICSRRRRGSGSAGQRAWRSLACCAEGVSAGRRRVGNWRYTDATCTLIACYCACGLATRSTHLGNSWLGCVDRSSGGNLFLCFFSTAALWRVSGGLPSSMPASTWFARCWDTSSSMHWLKARVMGSSERELLPSEQLDQAGMRGGGCWKRHTDTMLSPQARASHKQRAGPGACVRACCG